MSAPTHAENNFQPGSAEDVLGRMLTRTHSVNGTTRFEWDDWSIVREYAPSTTGSAVYDTAQYDGSDDYGWWGVTNYYLVNSMLQGVDYDNATMAVISDAMGHVRLVVSPSGTTPFSASYDAYGNLLSSSDSTPGGFFMNYVGAYGVRRDADTGLVYMRQRQYSPSLGRFISRDKIAGANRYTYSNNKPLNFTDPTGMIPRVDPGAHPVPITLTPGPYNQTYSDSSLQSGFLTPPAVNLTWTQSTVSAYNNSQLYGGANLNLTGVINFKRPGLLIEQGSIDCWLGEDPKDHRPGKVMPCKGTQKRYHFDVANGDQFYLPIPLGPASNDYEKNPIHHFMLVCQVRFNYRPIDTPGQGKWATGTFSYTFTYP